MADDSKETNETPTVMEDGGMTKAGDATQFGATSPGADSVIVALDTSGQVGGEANVSLRRLGDDAALPAVTAGRERYQVLGTLGEGGMGKVLLVADRDLKRHVAMKVMRPEARAHMRRFLEETQILSQLEHPNIVPLYDMAVTRDQQPYSTMRYLRGRTLEDVLKGLVARDPAVQREHSLTRLMQIFQQILQAMSYAHAKGVVHRDLKPANVMLGEHGEVQVLDWGLAKVLDRAELERPASAESTAEGQVMGTWAYMAPEQAMGQEVDERADIYALGVILYELLTLTRPIQGKTRFLLVRALLTETPESPRARAPGRNIPLELELIAMQALAKKPAKRTRSVEQILSAVQEWLEATADQVKRHELAEAKAAEGRALMSEYRQWKLDVLRLEAEAAEVAKRFAPWQPADEKGDAVAAEDRVLAARGKLVQVAAQAVAVLEKALGFEDDNASARDLLGDYYWDRFREAEANADAIDCAFFRDRVETYHGGKYARELQGDGTLTLTSEPAGAEVWLSTVVDRGFLRVPDEPRCLGRTPLAPLPLAMGSYLVVLRHPDFREVRYPVFISRNLAWQGSVKLYRDDEIGPDFVYVPGGTFVQGGDPDCRGNDLPRSEPCLDSFFLARHPVTMAEYLEFLDHLIGSEGVEAAMRRAPRPEESAPTYLRVVNGRLALPEVDAEGDVWHPRWPVCSISWHDAMAYCAWRSAMTGQSLALPSESEWEKAARGVDGRWFPWGNRFDPSLCNIGESRRERPSLVPVDEYPSDVSVYGVRGMAGNMRDWTSTERVEGEGQGARVGRVIRGGAWHARRILSRSAYRLHYVPSTVDDLIGFRLRRAPAR